MKRDFFCGFRAGAYDSDKSDQIQFLLKLISEVEHRRNYSEHPYDFCFHSF
jgi:hypothetical protein